MSEYKDDDLVYIDPSKKAIIGKVEFDKAGNPIKKEKVFEEAPKDKDGKDAAKNSKDAPKEKKKYRSNKKHYYIWGTYKSAKRMYNIEGKWKEEDNNKSLDEVMKLALKTAYWD